MTQRACCECGAPYTPRHPRHTRCPAHEQHGREHASPTTRAQDAEYERNRAIVLERDRGKRCPLCGKPGPLTEVDHITAVARGGGNGLDNLQATHPSCNRRKGATKRTGSANNGPIRGATDRPPILVR